MKRQRITSETVVAITGGAQGIGKEIARAFRARGARVVIGDVDFAAAVVTAAELDIHALPLDVTSADSCNEFVASVEQDFGHLDVFVNNAGVMWVGPFSQEPASATRSQLEVNLLGTINGMKAAGASMMTHGRGHLITVASAAAILAPPGEATYTATKHGILGYLKAVRAELHNTGITVTAIMPGVVDTTLARGTASGAARVLSPTEVAQSVVQAVQRPRFEITIPRFIGPVTRAVNILPVKLRETIFGALVPNQLRQADLTERAEYEARFGTDAGAAIPTHTHRPADLTTDAKNSNGNHIEPREPHETSQP